MADTVKVKKTHTPKKIAIDYSKGKIYKVVNDVNEKIYIGSTTTTLARRFSRHKVSKDTSPFHLAMEEIGVDHFKIILIENFPCASKDLLEAREYEVLNTFDKTLVFNARLGVTGITEDYRQKLKDNMKGKVGTDSPRFTRGSITKSQTTKKNVVYCGFIFSWQENGKQQGKGFSYGAKRTREIAYLMAIDHQNQIYPLTTKELLAELPFAAE